MRLKVPSCFDRLSTSGFCVRPEPLSSPKGEGRVHLWAVGLLLLVYSCALPTAKPVLRVGTSGDYPPFSIDGRGFDVDVARELGRSLGVRIEWVRFRWPDLAAAIG